MKIIDRFFQYIDYKGIKPTVFEKSIGLSNGYLGVQRKRNADIGEGVINKIIDNCLDLSIIWLIRGEGEMLKKNTDGDDTNFGSENKKNEHQDKKKCHDAQNNFNEKIAHPFNKSNTKENAHPFSENAHPLCIPNSEIGSDNANCFKLPMASEEPDSDRKVDTKNERFRELLDGGGIKEMLELKDALIGSQKAHIAALEAQLRDYRENITDLRRDLQELKKINKPVDHRSDGTTKDYTSSWDDVRGKKKR